MWETLSYQTLMIFNSVQYVRNLKFSRFFCIFVTLFVLRVKEGPLSTPRFLLYVQYLAGCRESNLSCCDRSQVCYQWATHIPDELHTSLWATHIPYELHTSLVSYTHPYEVHTSLMSYTHPYELHTSQMSYTHPNVSYTHSNFKVTSFFLTLYSVQYSMGEKP